MRKFRVRMTNYLQCRFQANVIDRVSAERGKKTKITESHIDADINVVAGRFLLY
jgi:hypothetical protein